MVQYVPVGHNKLESTVKRLCDSRGLCGYRMNHSFRATTATRLYEHGVDEQLICKKTDTSENFRSFIYFADEELKEPYEDEPLTNSGDEVEAQEVDDVDGLSTETLSKRFEKGTPCS